MRIHSAVLLSLLLLPAAADAAVELTLTGGFRGGETTFPIEARTTYPLNCFTTPCILADASTEGGKAHATLMLGVSITRRWMVEALLTRQDGDLRLSSGRSGVPHDTLGRETYEAATAQVGVLRHWGEGRFRPFAACALGRTRFESSALAYDRPLFSGITANPVNEEVLSGSVAGGLKAGLGRHIALRLEGRVFLHDLPERLGGTLRQNEASVGLTYRW